MEEWMGEDERKRKRVNWRGWMGEEEEDGWVEKKEEKEE